MTADRNGLTVSNTTMKWLNLLVVVCALLGPPVAYFTSVESSRAQQKLIDARQDEKIAEQQALNEKTDLKFEKINDRLSNIESGVNQIIGKLAK